MTIKKLLAPILTLPFLLSGATESKAGDFGEYKVKIHVTNAEQMKVKWWCKNADGSETKIDADTYPASTITTRTTNITSEKCPTGDWKVSFHIKAWGDWKQLKPGSSVCVFEDQCGYTNDGGWTYKTYARPSDFTGGASNNKLCTSSWNFGFEKIYVAKVGC